MKDNKQAAGLTDGQITEIYKAWILTGTGYHEFARAILARQAAPTVDASAYVAFNHAEKCSPTLTQCPRCNNPHNACDRGAPTVGSEPEAAQPAMTQAGRNFDVEQAARAIESMGDQELAARLRHAWKVQSATSAPQERAERAAVPDIAALVNRFLGWSLPESASTRLTPNVDRPIGTHLLSADEAKAMIEYALAAPAAQEGEQCAWTLDDPDNGIWQSSCGEAWSFVDGGPVENRVSFCQGCGKPLALKAAQQTSPQVDAPEGGAK